MGTPNETKFDLEIAIRQWRDQISQLDSLVPDAATELESHLRDSFNELCKLGLTNREAFQLARQRLGDENAIESEFSKAKPSVKWLNRMKWMLTGWLAIAAFTHISQNLIFFIQSIATLVLPSEGSNLGIGIVSFSLPLLTLWAAIFVGFRRHRNALCSVLDSVARTIGRSSLFGICAGGIAVIAVGAGLQILSTLIYNSNTTSSTGGTALINYNMVYTVLWPLVHYGGVIALAYWFHSQSTQIKPTRA